VSTVAHVCRKKLKVRLNISVTFLYCLINLARGGGRERARRMGACPGTQPAIFTRVLALDERSGEGEGDTCTPTPSPQAAITIETSIPRAPAELST
jgi:hypothetical protein